MTCTRKQPKRVDFFVDSEPYNPYLTLSGEDPLEGSGVGWDEIGMFIRDATDDPAEAAGLEENLESFYERARNRE